MRAQRSRLWHAGLQTHSRGQGDTNTHPAGLEGGFPKLRGRRRSELQDLMPTSSMVQGTGSPAVGTERPWGAMRHAVQPGAEVTRHGDSAHPGVP